MSGAEGDVGEPDRAYRAGGQRWAALITVLAVVLILAMVKLFAAVSIAVLIGIGLALLTLMALMVRETAHASTVATREALIVSRGYRPTRYPWSRILDIRAESGATSSNPNEQLVAVIYDSDRKRVVLPYVNERHLGGEAALTREIEGLRECWIARRGGDWVPRDDDIEQHLQARRIGQIALLMPVVALCLTAIIGVVVVATSNTVGSPRGQTPPLSLLFDPTVMIVIVPGAAFLLTAFGAAVLWWSKSRR